MRIKLWSIFASLSMVAVAGGCSDPLPPGSWHFNSIDGSAGISVDADPNHQWSGGISMVSFLDEPHIFGSDIHTGRLLQAWKTDVGWRVETLDDGSSGALTGPVLATGGSDMQVFTAVAQNPSYDVVRVRTYDTTRGWRAESVPLNVQPRTPVRVQVEALTSASTTTRRGVIVQLKLTYGSGEAEHALFSLTRATGTISGGWVGTWITTFLDPNQAVPASGRRAITGFHPTRVSVDTDGILFFGDAPSGDLIEVDTTRTPAVTRVVDGDTGGEHTTEDVSRGAAAVLDRTGYANVFYQTREFGTLRHSWETAAGWHTEVLDGTGGGERTSDEILPVIATALVDGETHVWYGSRPRGTAGGSVRLRHAWWDMTRWRYETFDGAGGGAGQRTSPVPISDPSVITIHGAPFVAFASLDTGSLRVAEWR